MVEDDLKVLLISPLPPPAGGIATWTKLFVEHSLEGKVKIDIVNSAIIGRRIEGGTFNLIDELRRTGGILLKYLFCLNKIKPNLIHLNSSCGKLGLARDLIISIIAKCKKIPILVHFHCNIEDQVKSKCTVKLFKYLSKNATRIIVLNNSSKEFVELNCNKKAAIIPNFITNEWINTTPKVIKDKIEIVTFIGHIRAEKGIEDIIEISKQFPEKEFKLAGKIMYENVNFSELENVELIGEINSENVMSLLNKTDLFLFPTRSEGFSISLLETMARGVPILTTPVGANLDMLENSGGVVVEAGDIKSFIKAINYLENKEIRRKISNWNIQKVKRTYLVSNVIDKITKEYYEIAR